MSIFLANLGSIDVGANITSPQTITLSRGVPAGSLLVIGGTWGGTSQGTTISSFTITDSRSNSYATEEQGSTSNPQPNSLIAYSILTNDLLSGDHITFALNGLSGFGDICLGAASFIGVSTPYGQNHNFQSSTSSNAASVTLSSITVGDLCIGVCGFQEAGTGFTINNTVGWSDIHSFQNGHTGFLMSYAKATSTSMTFSATDTDPTTRGSDIAIAAFTALAGDQAITTGGNSSYVSASGWPSIGGARPSSGQLWPRGDKF